jgi:hypothetical protein
MQRENAEVGIIRKFGSELFFEVPPQILFCVRLYASNSRDTLINQKNIHEYLLTNARFRKRLTIVSVLGKTRHEKYFQFKILILFQKALSLFIFMNAYFSIG